LGPKPPRRKRSTRTSGAALVRELSTRCSMNERSAAQVATSETTSPRVTSATIATSSRLRSDSIDQRTRSPPRRAQRVADAAERVDERRPQRVDLLAQVADVG